MLNIIHDNLTFKVPVKNWCSDIEKEALFQIRNLARLPFAFHHIAIMPDCHTGYGMPIGGILATKGVVIPNAVGVDIGCGMCAVKTSIKVNEMDTDTLKKIMGRIREEIPVGFNHHKEAQDRNLMPNRKFKEAIKLLIVNSEYDSALKQLGTLGGGNHFIEIQKDTEDNIWIMIHSGSRNLGYKVAKYYNDLAIALNKKWYSQIPKEWELAFLPIDSDEGKDYLQEMQYCIDFALANRKLMMERIKDIFQKEHDKQRKVLHIAVDFDEMTNIAHNYAQFENHFTQNVMVHRKGATLVREGTIGIIPGSQGTKSYIVEGLGNPDSFMSCSHGAGRIMSRTKAKNELNLEEEIKKLNEQGIIHGIRTTKDLDEASGAYKDINEVIDNQKDLVKVLVKLTPIAVIKG
jgi:tRNA-splicing ligase RtcB (3'-phosphate/5'-hydroxy nucleic acid ligase)